MILQYSQKVLLGGKVGIAALELGKVVASCLRKSSKSEYLDIRKYEQGPVEDQSIGRTFCE